MTTYTDVFGGDTIPPSEYAYALYVIAGDEDFRWPSEYDGTFGLLIASITELNPSSSGLTVTLPSAEQVSVGRDILFRNTGSYSIDVVDADGGAVATIAAGEAQYVYVADNSTAAGLWHLFTYGTGTSSADASALAGDGLEASSGKLRVSSGYQAVSGNYTILTSDRGKLLEVITGSITATLPLASAAGDGYYVYVHNSASGTMTVDGNGPETVDGGLTKTLAPGESAVFICNGTYWLTVGFGRDAEFVFSEFVVDMALTSVNLTSAQIAGRMIRLSGTASTNVTVTLPSLDNIYFVNVEAGLGGFQATFTTGSGATVSLTSSVRTALYCDGTNVTTAISTAVTSAVLLDDGSAITPSLRFALDPDTGLFRPGNNQIGFALAGTERMRLDANGFLRLGPTGTPLVQLHIESLNPRIDFNDTDAPSGQRYFSINAANGVMTFQRRQDNGDHIENALTIGVTGNLGVGATPASAPAGSSRFLAIGDNDTGIGQFGGGVLGVVADGVERLRVSSSSGRVTVYGDSEIQSGTPRLDLVEADAPAGYNTTSLLRSSNSFYIQTRNSTGSTVSTDYLAVGGSSGVSEHVWRTNNDEKMRLTSDGRLGIGATDPSEPRLQISGSATGSAWQESIWSNLTVASDVTGGYYGIRHRAATQAASFTLPSLHHFYTEQIEFGSGSTVVAQYGFTVTPSLTGATNNYGFYGNLSAASGRWNFYANGTASNYFAGDVYIGQNTSSSPGIGNTVNGVAFDAGLTTSFSRSSSFPISVNRNASTGDLISCRYNGSQVGSISVTGSTTAYNTSSDYRLKENVVPITGAAARVMMLKPRRFNFLADPDTVVDGFIAHEAQAVVPEAVHGAKDAVDDEGNPIMQGIDQSKLVPLLTAALQEALMTIDDLKMRVEELERVL